MLGLDEQDSPLPRGNNIFATTHWSVVLAAGQGGSLAAEEALEKLCHTYWYPIYAYVRRRAGDAHEAEDLTQEFFARLLGKNSLASVQREGGKFRSFLLTALKHFLINKWQQRQTAKRGGGKTLLSLDEVDAEKRYQFEPADETTPEVLFERRWAATVLEQVRRRLRARYAADGQAELFEALQPCLTGAEQTLAYVDLAARLGTSESAVKMAVHRLRKRYGESLRAEIALTVDSPAEVEAEIRCLIAAAGK